MPRSTLTRPDRRPAAVRIALFALGATAGLSAQPAAAVDILWDSDIAAYNAQQMPRPWSQAMLPGNDVLFSWGTESTPSNSVLYWYNDAPGATSLTVNNIRFATNLPSTPIGFGSAFPKGTGAVPAYEWYPGTADAPINNTWVKITIYDENFNPIGSPITTSLIRQADGSAYPNGATWYNITPGQTQQTPISLNITGLNITIPVNGEADFELYQTNKWAGQTYPDIVLAPMTVSLTADAATLQADDLSKNVRMGTNGTLTPTVNNTGATAAQNVTLAEVAAPFAPATTQNIGSIAAGGSNSTGSFTYTPVGTSGNPFPTDTTTVDITADNADPASFEMTGHGVGPVFNLSGTGVTGLAVNLGDVSVNSTLVRDLLLRNIFGENLGATDNGLASLTLINVCGYVHGGDPCEALPTTGPLQVTSDVTDDPNDNVVLASAGSQPTTPSPWTSPLKITFAPDQTGVFEYFLYFGTDVNRQLYSLNQTDPFTYYTVHITGNGVAVPLPATAALCGLGLALVRRRTRSR